jgi:hypothetical protein
MKRAKPTVLLLLVAVACLAGCGDPTAKVSGTVKLNSQPVSGAELVFVLENDANVEFQGLSTQDGSYQIDYGSKKAMPPGKYKVTVTWYRLRNGQPLPDGEEGDSLKGSPGVQQFSQPFSRDIAEGEAANFDFELDPKTKPVAN